MVQQDVAVADRREQVGACRDPRRDAGREGRILEVRAVREVIDRREPMQVDHRGNPVEILLRELELVEQVLDEIGRAVRGGLEPHGGAVATVRQFAFQRPAQILDFFLVDEQVAVPREPELIAADDAHALEEPGHELLHDRREQHEAQRGTAALRRQGQDARQRARSLHDGEVRLAPIGVTAFEPQDEVQALVLDAGEGARRVERERRDHRLDLALEKTREPVVVLGLPATRRQTLHTGAGHLRQQHLVEAGVLLRDQP